MLESDPVDLLSQSRPDKKLKPKREAKPPEKKFPSHKESADQSCYHCLGNHDHKGCPYKREKCYHCNKTGHIKRACKAKDREAQSTRPLVNYIDSDDGDDYLGSLEVHNMDYKDHVTWVSPEVQGR